MAEALAAAEADGLTRQLKHSVGNWCWLKPSIEFEVFLIVSFKLRILLVLMQDAVTYGQHLNLCAHEAVKRIGWGANDRFSPHIKTRIDQDRATSSFFKGRQQSVVAGIGLFMDGLHPC